MADNFLYEYTYDLGVSEGFYVTPIPLPTDFCGGTQPCSDDRVFQRAEAAARHAVEEHNRKSLGSTLEFLKIVNLNMRCAAGFVYYITVAAREGSEDEARLYEVDVWDMIFSGFRIDIFRPAPYSMKPSAPLNPQTPRPTRPPNPSTHSTHLTTQPSNPSTHSTPKPLDPLDPLNPSTLNLGPRAMVPALVDEHAWQIAYLRDGSNIEPRVTGHLLLVEKFMIPRTVNYYIKGKFIKEKVRPH
ncbi:Cysteine proteinase inhibitor 3 [Striga hermonthica]|uniref:Cysteine proteinase inhibitor 3 n=1 Tax=Striga hermonthica TaxID=68872 RepID=A0A9N7MV92_STRHE|nr:Cysteine proteinase inhibitor 3 [Striga hermonthica]